MSNHRLPRRASRSLASAVACGLALAAVTAGCEKKPADPAAPAAAGNGAAAPAVNKAGVGTVGVVDLQLVMKRMQWDVERQGKTDTAATELNNGKNAAIVQLKAILDEKRKQTIAAGKLSTEQINVLNGGGDLEKLPLTKDQREDWIKTVNGVLQIEQKVNQAHQQLAQKWSQDVELMYQEAIRQSARRVAPAKGFSTIVSTNVVFHTDPAADVTEAVIDDLRTAPPRIFPPPPRLNIQINTEEVQKATSQPTTAPAQPATKPTSSIR